MYSDKNLTCADCGQEFVFTASEQDFYAQRGFTEPRRCPSCRASRKAARNAEGGGSSYGGYGAGGGYSAGGPGTAAVVAAVATAPATAVPARCSAPPARTAAGGPGPVPPDERQARLLQRLLPEHARRLIQSSRCGPTHGPPNQRDPRPGPSADPGRFAFPGGQRSLDDGRLPASRPRSNLRSVPCSSRSMLSAWASQMSAAPDRRVEHVRQRRLGDHQQHQQHRREHRRRPEQRPERHVPGQQDHADEDRRREQHRDRLDHEHRPDPVPPRGRCGTRRRPTRWRRPPRPRRTGPRRAGRRRSRSGPAGPARRP